jgi:protein ImuB
MPRVISVFLPNWPVERRQRKQAGASALEDAPLILSVRIGNLREVFAANRIAHAAGLRVAMAVTKAQALVPGLIIENADPTADHEGLERLALWALRRYSPIVAADPPDGLVIEASGAAHLHGGEAAMLRDVVDRLAKAGFTARAAMADHWGAAHAAARYLATPIFLVPAGEGTSMLRQLPLAALRLADQTVADLRRLGFDRVGDLADKPRAPLALRFGPELHRRLDQAMGRLAESIDPARPPELIEVKNLCGAHRCGGNAGALYRHIG